MEHLIYLIYSLCLALHSQQSIMDMLRFNKFTIGHLWVGEFGSSEEDETQFNYLRNYSPLHNIGLPTNGQIQYPAILVTTADHDDRVVPAHSYKYVAELQHTVGGDPRQVRKGELFLFRSYIILRK